MSKNLEYGLLLDFYSFSLTKKQIGVLDMYYNEDLSLAEIARENNITRQAALDFIKRGSSKLVKMENELGLHEKFTVVSNALENSKQYIINLKRENKKIIDEIDTALKIWEDSDGVWGIDRKIKYRFF